jgi:hypothetical protein
MISHDFPSFRLGTRDLQHASKMFWTVQGRSGTRVLGSYDLKTDLFKGTDHCEEDFPLIMWWLAEVGADEFDRAWGRLGAKLGAGSRECTKHGQELRTSKQTRQKQVWERKVWERMVCRWLQLAKNTRQSSCVVQPKT